MLTWDKDVRRSQGGGVVSESYKATLPHWGEASVHPHIHPPGELFLDCLGLGIDRYPLGEIGILDALNPAEAVLMRTLKEHGIHCLEAMAAIGSTEDAEPSKSH